MKKILNSELCKQIFKFLIVGIIATIIDPPATLLNVVGDTSSSMMVARVVDGKDWMNINKKQRKLKEA